MKTLQQLFRNPNKYVVGLMSGTSADGVDTVIVEIKHNGVKTKLKQIAFHTYSYKPELKEFILKNSNSKTAKLDDIARLNILLGEIFADSALRLIRKAGLKPEDIDLIGSHGQTIQHLPGRKKMFGKNISATFQIGDPTIIAKRTGRVTVGDFRVADIAVGGSGAPLVPYFDYIIFRSEKINRGLLNIGGIANITVIPKSAKQSDIFAFDTGPGNMIIDKLMKLFFDKPYDAQGKRAFKGQIISALLNRMMQHDYFDKLPPKSTGRELFGDEFVKMILRSSKKHSPKDIITTATELSALSVYTSYLKFLKPKVHLDELIVSGGGAHNLYLMSALQRYFEPLKVSTIESAGYSSDAKEAICFAVLANETISGNCSNLTGATGAKHQTILGKICLP